jgi:hypothetical protein
MVENSPLSSGAPHRGSATGPVDGTAPRTSGTFFRRRPVRIVAICLASTLAVTTFMAVDFHRAPSVASSSPLQTWTTPRSIAGAPRAKTTTPTTSAPAPPVTTTSAPATPGTSVVPAPVTPTASVVPAPVAVLTAVQPAAVAPPIAALVAEVEATGIEPGSNWSWSMGDTATHCGPISGAGTGCTFGAAGLEYTVFAGSPNLSLVAHELANAETQNDAVPNLLSEVAAADGGSSWSPTDAVASCLVAHFMGIQDAAAGTWTCPSDVATFVANNIHDTLSTTVGVIPG